MLKERCGFTLPWLDLDTQEIQLYMMIPLVTPGEQLRMNIPADIISVVEGKNVL